MQTKDHEKKDHQDRESYKDILVKGLEKVPSRRGSRWQMKPHEGEHSQHDQSA